MDLKTLLRKYRMELATLLILIIVTVGFGLSIWTIYDPLEQNTRFYQNPSIKFPSLFNKSKSHNVEIDNPCVGITTEIWGYTEFHFSDDLNGGVTGSRMVIYNDFNDSKYDVGIIHHFYVIALYEYQLIKPTAKGDWVESGVHYRWEHPNDSMLFLGVNTQLNLPIVSGDLLVSDEINGSNYNWVDLGEIYIGGYDRLLKGFNFLTIDYGNSQARQTYYTGEYALFNDFFAVKKLKQFIIRDVVSWQIFRGQLHGWETIFSKTYYLGNNALEGFEGYENASGIILTPYD